MFANFSHISIVFVSFESFKVFKSDLNLFFLKTNIVTEMKMPKQLNSRCKELVASLIRYFEEERENNGPLLPLGAVREVSFNQLFHTLTIQLFFFLACCCSSESEHFDCEYNINSSFQ